MSNYKLFLIKLVTFLGGLYFLLEFLLPEKNGILTFKNFHEHISNGFTLVAAMAIGLGIINLTYVHGGKLIYKKSDWLFSAILLGALAVMLTVQGLDWYRRSANAAKVSELLVLRDFSKQITKDAELQTAGVLPRAERENLLAKSLELQLSKVATLAVGNPDLLASVERSQQFLAMIAPWSDEQHRNLQEQISASAALYRDQIDRSYGVGVLSNVATFLNQGLFVALGSAMFSLLGFYIAAAAYRAFRVRSVEASLMMLAALIVMLGQIPFGVWISSHLPEMRMWLLQVPSAGAARAIEIGAGIAGLILSIRMWLSLESGSFKR